MNSGSQKTAALYLGMAFLAGTIIGGAGMYFYAHTPVTAASTREQNSRNLRQTYLSEMKERLQLSGEQATRVSEVLDQTRELFRQVQDKHRPEFQAIQDHQTEMIRAVLDPKQQAEYEKLRAERQELARRKKRP